MWLLEHDEMVVSHDITSKAESCCSLYTDGDSLVAHQELDGMSNSTPLMVQENQQVADVQTEQARHHLSDRATLNRPAYLTCSSHVVALLAECAGP